jgi:hypothetical protein
LSCSSFEVVEAQVTLGSTGECDLRLPNLAATPLPAVEGICTYDRNIHTTTEPNCNGKRIPPERADLNFRSFAVARARRPGAQGFWFTLASVSY